MLWFRYTHLKALEARFAKARRDAKSVEDVVKLTAWAAKIVAIKLSDRRPVICAGDSDKWDECLARDITEAARAAGGG